MGGHTHGSHAAHLPDGVLLAGCGTLYALWVGWRQEQNAPSPLVWLWPALLYVSIVTAIYAPYFLWRWTYYGYLLPNTFYAKMVGTDTRLQRGIAYLWLFVHDDLLLVVGGAGMIAGVRLWWSGHRQHRAALALPAGFTLLTTTYIVLVGDDWMPSARFFVVVVPLLALFGAVLIAWVAGSIRGQRVIFRSMLAVGLVLLVSTLLIMRLPEEATDHQSDVWGCFYQVRRSVAEVSQF